MCAQCKWGVGVEMLPVSANSVRESFTFVSLPLWTLPLWTLPLWTLPLWTQGKMGGHNSQCGLWTEVHSPQSTVHSPQSTPKHAQHMAYQAPPAAAAPAPAPAPAPRPTGLGTQGVAASGGKKARQKRKSAPMREGPVWKSVRVTKEHDTAPQVQCLSCEKLTSAAGRR